MAYSEKSEFLANLDEKLGEIKNSMETVKSDMEDATDDEKAKLNERLEKLQEKHDEGTRRMEEFKGLSETLWVGLKDEIEEFWAKLTSD